MIQIIPNRVNKGVNSAQKVWILHKKVNSFFVKTFHAVCNSMRVHLYALETVYQYLKDFGYV